MVLLGTPQDLGEKELSLNSVIPATSPTFASTPATTDPILLWWPRSEIYVWLDAGDLGRMDWAFPAGAAEVLVCSGLLPPTPKLKYA